MSDLEQELRATLARHAPGPDDVRAPRWTGAPDRAGSRAFAVPAVAVAAVLAVIAVVVGVGALVGRDGAAPPVAAPAGPWPVEPGLRPVPDGFRPVSYRGFEVLVREELATARLRCGDSWHFGEDERPESPERGAVAVGPPSPDADCAAATGGVVDTPYVRLMPDDVGDGRALARRATVPVTVAGGRALLVCPEHVELPCAQDRYDGAAAMHFPDQGVVLTATVLGVGLSQQVMSSARVVEVDSLGCVTRATESPLPAERVDDTLLWEGTGERVVVCLYRGGVSEGSGTVTGRAARTAVELLSVARPPLPDGVLAGEDSTQSMCVSTPPPAFDLAGVRVELADGRVANLAVQPVGCDPHVVVDAGDGTGPRLAAPDGRELDLLTGVRGRS